MGAKPDDDEVCYSCSACHDLIDGRSDDRYLQLVRNIEYEKARAMQETRKILKDLGLIKI